MSKPWIHSLSSARKYGGKPEDYMECHTFMDSSKGAITDNRHRCLTHSSFFLSNIAERIKFSNSCEAIGNTFPTIINSDGKHVSVRDILETHILEDFKGRFIPSAQDYLEHLEFKDWMNNAANGDVPSSYKKLKQHIKSKQPKLTFLQKIKNYFNPKKQQTIKISHD